MPSPLCSNMSWRELRSITASHALHIGVQRKLVSYLTACRLILCPWCLKFLVHGAAALGLLEEQLVSVRSSLPDYSVATKQWFGHYSHHSCSVVMHL